MEIVERFRSFRDVFRIERKEEESAKIAGVEVKLAEFSQEEIRKVLDMLDSLFYQNAYPAVRSLIAENLDLIIDLIRIVKAETKQDFGGIRAKGNQLTLVRVTADMLGTVWGQSGKTDFTYTATSTGPVFYIGTDTNPEKTTEEEGIIYLGFVEKAVTPKTNKLQLTKHKEPYLPFDLNWEVDQDIYLAKLVEPIMILPETEYYMKTNFYKVGTVEMEPIALKVMQAKNVPRL